MSRAKDLKKRYQDLTEKHWGWHCPEHGWVCWCRKRDAHQRKIVRPAFEAIRRECLEALGWSPEETPEQFKERKGQGCSVRETYLATTPELIDSLSAVELGADSR